MPSVTATKPTKKHTATVLIPSMARLALDVGDHGVVPGIGPADVDPREQPREEDHADADRNSQGDLSEDSVSEKIAVEGDEDDEAVVHHQGQDRENQRDPVLAGDQVFELGVVEKVKVPPMLVAH